MSPTPERARLAVAVAFVANGVAFASWVSRTPAVRDTLSLDKAQLGLLLLCASIGSLAALPLSGAVVHRLGPARTVLGGGGVVVAGLLLAAGGCRGPTSCTPRSGWCWSGWASAHGTSR